MTDNKLTKKELNKIYIKTFWLQLGWNYEAMQGIGYFHAMSPILEKNYQNDPDKIKAAKCYTEFFNCNPHLAATIIGANIALEEEQPKNLELSRNLKLSLMGPLSSIGDTLVVAVFGSIIFALNASLALSGSEFAWISGIVPVLFFTTPVNILRYKFFHAGHKFGKEVFTKYNEKFELIKKYGYMFGLLIIGGLAASMIKISFPEAILIGEVELGLNGLINQIFPGLLTLIILFLSYWLLGLKKMNSTRLLILVLLLGTILGSLGILV